MIDEMKAYNLPEPNFRNTSSGFEVTLTGPGKSFEEEVDPVRLSYLTG
jgi:predicted HTH transcriptional regulator